MKTSIDRIKELIAKLPHSEGRVPYTYHHDYLRSNCSTLKGCSRSDVAILSEDEDPVSLYACCLVQIVTDAGVESTILKLDDNDFNLLKACIKRAHNTVHFYDNKDQML